MIDSLTGRDREKKKIERQSNSQTGSERNIKNIKRETEKTQTGTQRDRQKKRGQDILMSVAVNFWFFSQVVEFCKFCI